MRFALFLKLSFLLLVATAAYCQPPGQEINPHTQIRWPANCRIGPGMTYNWLDNTCIDMFSINPGNLQWPSSCSGPNQVYVPQTNTCITNGSAGNPAGNPSEVQMNANGVFGSSPNFTYTESTGLNAMPGGNGQGISGNGIAVQMLPGYKQNSGTVNSNARMHNRDQQTSMSASPQDFCPTAGNGYTDDTPCVDDAIRWLASLNTSAPKRLVIPWTPNGYLFTNDGARYQAVLPYDFGDYHGSAGFVSPASAQIYVDNNGAITGCSIQGGTGYAPNAYLPIQIIDPQHRGSGGAAYVQTNASGVPNSSCTVQLAGMRYPTTGVIAAVQPVGGDGAAGTVTLSGGTFSAVTLTSGGSGYSSSTTYRPAVMVPGLTCASYPVFQATVTAGTTAIASVAITSAGTTCTIGGNNSPGTVNLVFGASCGGVQCTILPPDTPRTIPISVALLSGVEIVGIGNPTINTECVMSAACYTPELTPASVNFVNGAAFGDPWGDQGGGFRVDISGGTLPGNIIARSVPPVVRGISVNAMWAFWFPLLGGGTFSELTLGYGMGFHIGATQQSLSSTIFNPITLDHVTFNAVVGGIYVGGDWHSRNINSGAGGNYGGNIMGHFGNNGVSGLFNEVPYGASGGLNLTNIAYSNQTGSILTDASFDYWVENFLWKSWASPPTPYTDATHMLSNGTTACVLNTGTTNIGTPHPPAITFNRRATDENFGNQQPTSSNQWSNCFRGVRGFMVNAQQRYSNGYALGGSTSTDSYFFSMTNVKAYNRTRALYLGGPQTVEIKQVLDANVGAWADPYLATSPITTNTAIWLQTQRSSFSGSIEDIYGPANGVLQGWFWGIPSAVNGYTGTASQIPLMNLVLRNLTSIPNQSGNLSPASMVGKQTGISSNTTLTVFNCTGTANGCAANGMYRVSIAMYTTTAATGGTATSCVNWTDGAGAASVCGVPSGTAAATPTRFGYVQVLHSSSGTISTTNNCTGGTVCNVDWAVEKLQ